MAEALREHSLPLAGSVLVHGLLALALILSAKFSINRSAQSSLGPTINAVAVDSQLLKNVQTRKQDQLDAQARKAAAEARLREEEAERQRLAEQQRQAEAEKAAQEEAARVTAAKAAAEQAETQKAASLAASNAAAKAAAAKAAASEQAAAKLAATKRAEAAARAQSAAEQQRNESTKTVDQQARAQREAELRRQMAAEEHLSALQAGPQQASYIASIQNRITRAWLKPASARSGIVCKIEVTQIAGGEVTRAHVTDCNGDEAVRQSIENAVYRASPLPQPSDPALFQRNLTLVFKPNE
jgi:colicin import membrane protein